MGSHPVLTVLSLNLAFIFAIPFARADSALYLNRTSGGGASSFSEGIELVCIGQEIARSVCRVAKTRGEEVLESEAVTSAEAAVFLRSVTRQFARMPSESRSPASPPGPGLRVALDFEGENVVRAYRISKNSIDLVPILAIEVELTRKLKR